MAKRKQKRFGSTVEEHTRRAKSLAKMGREFTQGTLRALRNDNCASALNHMMRASRVTARLQAEKQGAGRKHGMSASSRALRSLEAKFKKACVR